MAKPLVALVVGMACVACGAAGTSTAATTAATTTPVVGEAGGLAVAEPLPAEAVTEAGTDSAATSAAAEIDPALRATLVDFGERYLAYDYRVPHHERVESLQGLTSPELYEQLARPLPPAVVDELAAEQRVVEAQLSEVVPVEPGVFQLSLVVTTWAGAPSAGALSAEEARMLVVSVGDDQRVTDVR